jgi:hypothetical protein
MWFKPSIEVGGSNGVIKIWIDGVLDISVTDLVTTDETNNNNTFYGEWRIIPYAQNYNTDLQIDDAVMDYTQTRVMLCANADGTGHREIQIPTAWSDSQITITVNQGSFTTGETAYLCVFDSNGDVVASQAVTIGSTYQQIKSTIRPTSGSNTISMTGGSGSNTITIN